MNGQARALPQTIAPMRAVIGELPNDDDEEWAYEVKWDGIRAIGFIFGGRLRLQSANGIDITVRYPELAPLGEELRDHTIVIDGEVVTFNEEGRPDFGMLQPRMHNNSLRSIANLA